VSEASGGGYELNTDSGNRPVRAPLSGLRALTPAYRETEAAPGDGNWRLTFAENMVRDPMFARNLANRIWKQMFGLALADPVDGLDPLRLDPGNPPSAPWEMQATHPALLEKLAAELAREDFKLQPFLRTLAQSAAYQLSSRYDGTRAENEPLFARHYARRLEGEEVHDAIAKATGIPGDYTIPGWENRVEWAVQLPEPVEPASNARVNNFLNAFLRGNRDTQERSQSGSIQQQLYLMNDSFVTGRVKVAASSRLREIAGLTNDDELVEELYLTFLSRRPTAKEKAAVAGILSGARAPAARNRAVEDLAWMCVNKVEFLYSY